MRISEFLNAPYEDVQGLYREVLHRRDPAALRRLALEDRYFLLTYLLHRRDALDPWIYSRCREVERAPDGYLDLWAREHYKSTIITFAGIIQEVLRDPEITSGIFSHVRPVAKKFLAQIKYEFETNEKLKILFADVLYSNPAKQSPRWSLDRGLIQKRSGNPKEGTVEAHGLVDSMPTGMHFRLRVYDDVVTEDSVTTPEMIAKTTDAWALSINLGTQGGREWYIGTRYHFSDTYNEMIRRGAVIERRYPATEDGTPSGVPVLLTPQDLEAKRRTMGPYIFAAQMLCSPVADEAQGFRREWLRFYESQLSRPLYNVYILCDPASMKKKTSDYTCFVVIGMTANQQYHILEFFRDRLNLAERADVLFSLVRKWKPQAVGYEKYGKDSDIEYFFERMQTQHLHFGIIPLGGIVQKEDRIRRLIPRFEQGRVLLPERQTFVDRETRRHDLVQDFIEEEYTGFPVSQHDDMLDCMARILDPEMPSVFPSKQEATEREEEADPRRSRYTGKKKEQFGSTSWMAD